MKAIVYDHYGSPEVLKLVDIPQPIPSDVQALIKIHAVSINGSDREGLVGKPFYTRAGGLLKPGNPILGSDIAGRVEQIGVNHTEFKVGDEVFGEIPGYHGGFAEYVCTHGRTMAMKPAELSFEEAAAIPQGGVIALNGILTKGRVQAGQQVLINGAGGSAGTFAIQLAKLAGAEVTGVDNAGKADFIRSLGADQVVDYTREDFTMHKKRYDLILDLIAHRSVFASVRALKPGGTYFVVGGSTRVLLQALIFAPLLKRTRGVHTGLLAVPQNRKDLIEVTEMFRAGKIKAFIDRSFPLEETQEAMRYVTEGLARGKIVINCSYEL